MVCQVTVSILTDYRLVGQGYNGCSAVAEWIGGIQELIRDRYPKTFSVGPVTK
jgi:hypothetical protein